MASQVASGEFDACYCAIHHVKALQAKKAPIGIAIPGETVFAPVQTVQLPGKIPHPHAAMLFLDFLVSAEGGEAVLKNNGYLATHPTLASSYSDLNGHKLWILTPEMLDANLADWSEIMRTRFK